MATNFNESNECLKDKCHEFNECKLRELAKIPELQKTFDEITAEHSNKQHEQEQCQREVDANKDAVDRFTQRLR